MSVRARVLIVARDDALAGQLAEGLDRLGWRTLTARGPYAALAEWLETNAARFGFFRPFRGLLSGVQPEPWHLSFAPVAENARRALTPAVLRKAIDTAPILGKQELLAQLDTLHERYVAAIDWP